jgi:hypothetical protein
MLLFAAHSRDVPLRRLWRGLLFVAIGLGMQFVGELLFVGPHHVLAMLLLLFGMQVWGFAALYCGVKIANEAESAPAAQ